MWEEERQRAKVFHAHNIFVFFIIIVIIIFIIIIEQIYLFHSFNEWIACNMGWGMRGNKKKKIENVSSYYWACTVLIFIQCLLVVAHLIYTLSSQSIITSFSAHVREIHIWKDEKKNYKQINSHFFSSSILFSCLFFCGNNNFIYVYLL